VVAVEVGMIEGTNRTAITKNESNKVKRVKQGKKQVERKINRGLYLRTTLSLLVKAVDVQLTTQGIKATICRRSEQERSQSTT
jgi:regulator of extracellular matrix RemA (YlzA/DUF370 family)